MFIRKIRHKLVSRQRSIKNALVDLELISEIITSYSGKLTINNFIQISCRHTSKHSGDMFYMVVDGICGLYVNLDYRYTDFFKKVDNDEINDINLNDLHTAVHALLAEICNLNSEKNHASGISEIVKILKRSSK